MSSFAPVLRALLRPSVTRRAVCGPAPRTFASTTRVFAAPSFLQKEQPRLRLGADAPNFTAHTTHGTLDFYECVSPSIDPPTGGLR